MRIFKHIQFSEGINNTLAEFKKDFAPVLKGLSDDEVKQAHKVVTKGNGNNTKSSGKIKKANKIEDKK